VENKRLKNLVATDAETGFFNSCVAQKLVAHEREFFQPHLSWRLMAIVVDVNSNGRPPSDHDVAHVIKQVTSESDIPFHYKQGQFMILVRTSASVRTRSIITALKEGIAALPSRTQAPFSAFVEHLSLGDEETAGGFLKRIDQQFTPSPIIRVKSVAKPTRPQISL
jgi:hypothetical protein